VDRASALFRMPTDQQVSILVDIASSGGVSLPSERLADIRALIAGGYVETAAAGPRYRLTAAGQGVLDARGVGANES
jgi:hypothetical protein